MINAAIMNFISNGDIEGSKKNTLLLRENNKEVEKSKWGYNISNFFLMIA